MPPLQFAVLAGFIALACGRASSSSGGAAAWLGDSLTNFYQHAATNRPPELLAARLESARWTVRNHGVGGDTTAKIRDRWRTDVRDGGYDALIYLGGVNDVAAGYSGAAAWENVRATVEEAQSDGLRVLLLTVLPWGSASVWTPAKQAETELLNARIREWCTGVNAGTSTHCVDAYVAFGAPNRPAALSPTYDIGDGVHLTELAGNARLVDLVCERWPTPCFASR